MMNAYRWLNADNIGDTIVSYTTNLFFNGVDIYDELYSLGVYYYF